MSRHVQEFFNEWAGSYGSSRAESLPVLVERDKFQAALKVGPQDIVLDVGTGTGRIVGQLVGKVESITGLDIAEKMLERARENFPAARFVQADIERELPFANETFTVVTCSLTLQFVEKLEHVLREFFRVLKPGGRAYLSDFVTDGTLDWDDVEYKQEKTFKGSIGAISHFRSQATYRKLIAEAGFEIRQEIPLVVSAEAKRILTQASYEKVRGKWASLIFELQKPAG